MEPEITEAQAWRRIAALIEKGEWNHHGLCNELLNLFDEDVITWGMKNIMQDRLNYHMDAVAFYAMQKSGIETGPWAFNEGDADVRILAAYFLALDAEDYPDDAL